MKVTLPKWYDLHVHLRQGDALPAYIQAQIDMGCTGVLAMPNTKPPVAKLLESDHGDTWSIEHYHALIQNAGGDKLSTIIIPLYLTKNTSPETIKNGVDNGLLKACKYYPPHGTTGADSAAPLQTYIDNGVFSAMEETGIILCIHGEKHGLTGQEYFDRNTNAEEAFYQDEMPALVQKFPNLKIVCEHITTKVAVDFTNQSNNNIAASITPQHLLYTIGDMLKGLNYHLYCLPLVKYEQDRQALRDAATSANNTKFFAGTDSAPHTTKATECGCAAGCFTGEIAPQLYAQAFEETGIDLSQDKGQEALKRFLCTVGAKFYNLPISSETFTLIKQDQAVTKLKTPTGEITPLPLGMGQTTIPWSIES